MGGGGGGVGVGGGGGQNIMAITKTPPVLQNQRCFLRCPVCMVYIVTLYSISYT